MRSGRTKKLGSRTVGVGNRTWSELSDESAGVDRGDKVEELLSKDMPSQVRAIEEQLGSESMEY